jgi:integrase
MSKRETAKKSEFPKTITRDSIAVKIYRATNDEKFEYHLVYRQGGVRKQIVSRKLEALEKRAEEVLDDLSAARPADTNSLTAFEREEFAIVRANLAEVKIPLALAVQHYVEAVKLLGRDLVIEAARFYQKRHTFEPRTIEQVASELVTAKRARNRSAVHVNRLDSHLTAFAGSCVNVQISDITRVEIERFLDALELGPRSYNNYRASLICLFNFAKARKYIAADWNEFAAIDREDAAGEEIEIYSPEQLKDILAEAVTKTPELIPFLALGAFAGLRSKEILRLSWDAINFEAGTITVKGKFKTPDGKVARVAKTGTRRIVPILPALRAWLAPRKQLTGKVWPHSEPLLYKRLRKLTAVERAHNALRHSFVSYRVAELKNVEAVALEAGNSPQVIFANYRELAADTVAKAWFSITPIAALLKAA